MVKKQVFEMLAGVCLYSSRGYELALASLEHFKVRSPTQPAFTCSKLTIETLEQGVKYVQS